MSLIGSSSKTSTSKTTLPSTSLTLSSASPSSGTSSSKTTLPGSSSKTYSSETTLSSSSVTSSSESPSSSTPSSKTTLPSSSVTSSSVLPSSSTSSSKSTIPGSRRKAFSFLLLDHPDDEEFTLDYLFNEDRPTFIGPRRQGSMYDFPFMSEFLALRWLNEKEWKDLEFDHWASFRTLNLEGYRDRLEQFEQQSLWIKDYENKRRKYDRAEQIWRRGGKKEDFEQGKTYRQLKSERLSFEDVYPEFKEDKFSTLPHELEMMRDGGHLPMPPPRPRDLNLEELPREYEQIYDPGFAGAPYDF